MRIDTEAGARVLFAETFAGTLPIFPNWDDQPAAFQQQMRETAKAVAEAALIEDDAPA